MTEGTALVTTAWGLASALGVIVLGGISLSGGRTRPPGSLAFALFCLVWGVATLLANLLNLTDDPYVATLLYLLLLTFLLPLPYFLLEFAMAHLTDVRRPAVWAALRWAAFGVGAAGAATLLLAPDLLLTGVAPGPTIRARWGPLFTLLASGPHFLAFGVALLVLYLASRSSPTERVASRILLLLSGLGLYAGFAAANHLMGGLLSPTRVRGSVPYLILFGSLAVISLGVAVALWREAARRPIREEARRRRAAALAILLPAAWGAAEAAAGWDIAYGLQTAGLWRLAAVSVLTYGVLRWRVWDLPRQARRAAANAAGVTTAGAGGALAYGAASLLLPWPAGGALVGLAVAGAALVPSVRAASRILAPPPLPPRGTSGRYGDRLEAYRAALERSVSAGTIDEDARFLEALRLRFGLEPAEHRVLLHYARQSIPVRREGAPLESYDRLRLLGEGGSSRTWLARDRGRDRLVVLKEPLARWHRDDRLRRRVLREARLAAKIRHPNVVRTEAVVETPQGPFLVLEFVEGGSLADLLRTRGPLPWPEAVTFLASVAAGVDAIHRAGVVHRDLKPGNILLDGDGVAKVGDFGIAVGDRHDTVEEGGSGAAGTRPYMAPEAAAGQPVDRRADVYGCAAILHEMIYGVPPGEEAAVVRNDVPARGVAALARGLAPDPAQRYPSARALVEACREDP